MQAVHPDPDPEIHQLRETIKALRARLDAAEARCARRLADCEQRHADRRRELEATIVVLNRRLRRQAARDIETNAPDCR